MTADADRSDGQNDRATWRTCVHRLSPHCDAATPEDDVVVREQPVTVMVEQVGNFTLVCTPTDLEALAVGFAYCEGLIDDRNDLLAVAVGKHDPNTVAVRINQPHRLTSQQNRVVSSSSGLCGACNIEKLLAELRPCDRSLTVSRDILFAVTEDLRRMQRVFQATGGSHAAGIFDATGSIVAFAEDIGRHNALDKAIGKSVLAGRPTRGCGVALSGRVSFEMVAKAARAGLEMIVAVSAASSMAVEAAERWHVTLCGFVRPDRANTYTHPDRIDSP